MTAAIRTEANFLAELADVPEDMVPFPELYPGITVGMAREMLRRPADDPPGSKFIPSATYSAAAGDTGQMAIYARVDSSERAPIVVFVHGGGWNSGHHYDAIRYLYPLVERGYVGATLTYRLADEAPWPAAIEDAKCAIRWLRHHAAELGGDPDRIVISGGSAGGHLAALVALLPGTYEGDGGWADTSSEVQGAFLVSPAVDLEAMAELGVVTHLREYFGNDLAKASPMNHVSAGSPPVMTITGDQDPITPAEYIERFHAALRAAGVDQRLEIAPGCTHGFDLFPDHLVRVRSLLIDFVDDVLGSPD